MSEYVLTEGEARPPLDAAHGVAGLELFELCPREVAGVVMYYIVLQFRKYHCIEQRTTTLRPPGRLRAGDEPRLARGPDLSSNTIQYNTMP